MKNRKKNNKKVKRRNKKMKRLDNKGEITTLALIGVLLFGALTGSIITKCKLDPDSCKKKTICIEETIDENTIKKTCRDEY